MTAAEASGEAGGGESAAHRAAESAGGGHRETAAEHDKESACSASTRSPHRW
jgi:hypothetical protein